MHAHRPQLNFGDCAVYTLAAMCGEPLLATGEDFAATDFTSAPLQDLEAEPAPMASNRGMKFLLAALLAPGLCLGAIWPDNIGVWKRAATTQATLFDRPIWDEYGLKESEAARYEAGAAGGGGGGWTAGGAWQLPALVHGTQAGRRGIGRAVRWPAQRGYYRIADLAGQSAYPGSRGQQ